MAATVAPVAPAAPTPPRAPAANEKIGGKVDRQSPEFRAKLAQKIREGIARKKAAATTARAADVAPTPEPKPAPATLATSSSPRHHRGFGSFLSGLKTVKPPKDAAPAAVVDDDNSDDEAEEGDGE